jgi:hypothetical protein
VWRALCIFSPLSVPSGDDPGVSQAAIPPFVGRVRAHRLPGYLYKGEPVDTFEYGCPRN